MKVNKGFSSIDFLMSIFSFIAVSMIAVAIILLIENAINKNSQTDIPQEPIQYEGSN